MFAQVNMYQAGCRQLPEDAFPGAFIKIAADTESGQAVMSPLPHFVVCLAAQQVDQVADAEAHAGAVNGGQRFLCGQGAVPEFGRISADVAVTAGHALLAEIVE